MKKNLNRAAETYLKYHYHVSKETHPKKPIPLFITISRQVGAGGITVAETLSHLLNDGLPHSEKCPWTVFDRGLIDLVLEENHYPQSFAKYMREETISDVRDTIDDILGLHPSVMTLNRQTQEAIIHLAHMGNCVLIGRGSNIITKDMKGGFHVRLVGSYEKRLEHLEEYYQISKVAAKEFIFKEDVNRKQYIKKYFDKDINDFLLYNLIINTDRLTYQAASELIVEAAKRHFENIQK